MRMLFTDAIFAKNLIKNYLSILKSQLKGFKFLKVYFDDQSLKYQLFCLSDYWNLFDW